jgi:phosphate uptake regulator
VAGSVDSEVIMSFWDLFKGEQPPLVEQAFEDVQVMLRNGHEMFAAATAYLLDNEILDIDLKKLDEEINGREQNLRRAVLEHLTFDPDRELVFSLKLISIVHEAERIGDIAKSLAKVGAIAKKPRMGPSVEPLRAFRDVVLKMFERGRAAFVEGDVEVARVLMEDHERLKDDVTRYLNQLAEREDITPNEGIVFALSARLVSRVGSHLANIASTVVASFDQIRRAPTWTEERKAGA